MILVLVICLFSYLLIYFPSGSNDWVLIAESLLVEGRGQECSREEGVSSAE